MHKIYIDSETCGLHSMPVLLQYAVDDGPIRLYDIWKHPVGETLELLEWIAANTVVGFNLVFDWFHCCKIYTIWRLCPGDWIPEQHIEEIAQLEPRGMDGPCLKPVSALDLMLHSRKGAMQSLMAREDVRIRRVPAVLAQPLATELEKRVQIDGIYFARRANPDAPRWQVLDRKRKDGTPERDFKDVCLRFSPAGGLKFLAEHLLGYVPKFHYKDIEPPTEWRPYELGYAPTALHVSCPEKNWEVWGKHRQTGKDKLLGRAWPAVVKQFIDYWAAEEDAREYAKDDIVYTRELDKYFGSPEPGDDDSILACMVPAIRWRGFKIDIEGIKALRDHALEVVEDSPVNVNKPSEVRAYLSATMDATEQVFIEETTRKAKLVAIKNWQIEVQDADEFPEARILDNWRVTEEESCTKCDGTGTYEECVCQRCKGSGSLKPGPHPAAIRAKELLAIKEAVKEVELYNKLLFAGRFHTAFNVIGTLSSRMSGDGGLNAQGIKKTKEVRMQFPLAWDGYQLCGGDFDSFEVTLADAVYNDPALRAELLKGRKIHALFGMAMYPGHTYEEIIESAGTDNDMYGKAKSGVFAMIYGGNWETLQRKFGIAAEVARQAEETWYSWFPGISRARQGTFDKFCSIKQLDNRQVIWGEPADYIESFLGFCRYFTLENRICKAVFDLAQKPPKEWRNCPIKVVRRDRVQTAGGAVSSALYGAAFGIQNNNMRAAANHEIQSPGGQITKSVQRAVWDLQPAGTHEFLVAPLNVHDELMVTTHPRMVPSVTEKVRVTVESYRPKVPLIGMTWFEHMENWAEKKGGAEPVKIRAPEMTAV
jgi:hypothetical protein